MEVKAIVLVAGPSGDGQNNERTKLVPGPVAMAGVLGRPAIHHLLKNLASQNVGEIAVVSTAAMPALSASARREQVASSWIVAESAQLWRAAEECFNDLAQRGAEEILILRVGAYVELDLESLLQAHLDNRTHATRARGKHGSPMDVYIVTASRRNEAAYLFRHRMNETRSRCGWWRFQGYSNALETPHDIRCLAVDGLLGENSIIPAGRQVRPGVWIGEGAQVHPRARVLAPAYIGESAKIRCNAVITRCSVVEHHAEIDYGSVVEDASILPLTYIGPGLDIIRSVAGSGHVASLDRGAEVEIADSRLLRAMSPNAGRRVLANAASLAAFLPTQLLRGLFAYTRRSKPAQLSAAVAAPSALNTPAGFPAPAQTAVEASSYQRTWQ